MSRDALFAQNINLKGKLKIPCPALMVSLLCFSWYLREVQNALCWVWWFWTGFWIQLHALKRHFQLQILFKSKTRVYWSTKAEFRFFLIDFVPFLMFHIGMCHVDVTIKKPCDFGCVLNLFFQLIKILSQRKLLHVIQHWTACLISTWLVKHHILFATNKGATFGGNWFRIMPDIVSKLCASSSEVAVLFKSNLCRRPFLGQLVN